MSAGIWSRIEAVITGRTRNAFALRGTRVRIPPTPLHEKALRQVSLPRGFFLRTFLSAADKGFTKSDYLASSVRNPDTC